MTELVFYLARAANGVIGDAGGLPWSIPEDLQRFRRMTLGKPMVMGRKTFESFPALLKGRRHIVLTRDRDWTAPGAEVVHDVEAAIAQVGDVPEVAVIGGAEVFALFLPRADRVELTEVHTEPGGDAIVPCFDPAHWRETVREDRDGYSFVTLVRRRLAGLIESANHFL